MLLALTGLADLLVGVTGDFVPAREVLRPGYLLNLFRQSSAPPAPALAPAPAPAPKVSSACETMRPR